MKSTAIMKPTLVKDNQPYHAAVGSEVDGRRFQNYFCEVTSESEFKESASRKKVHFTPPSSPVLFEERVVTNKNQSMLNQEHTRCLGVIFSIFSVSVAIAAVTGCVFLYYNMKENQSQISALRKELLGSSKFHSKREGFSGWINYIQEKTFQMNSEIEKMKAWANVSTCLKGHDFTKGNFCYRLLRFKVSFNQAEAFCHRRGGHLAFAENNKIWNATLFFLWDSGLSNQELWTGVRKDQWGIWRYTTGKRASFTKWHLGNIFDDGDNCAIIRANADYSKAAMYDRNCEVNSATTPKPFLCRFRIR
ncbi:uncharacterized protein LOC143462930 [Clavelina lepadiformis]|uniref:uncharacterized protein LOC143462930 n=1 Tax=Clavelina lepadiformis TaxID=159417 RepID=UPI0040415E55